MGRKFITEYDAIPETTRTVTVKFEVNPEIEPRDFADTLGEAIAEYFIAPAVPGWDVSDGPYHEQVENDREEWCACGQSLADGEGYDGLCGDCADKAEKEGRWD